MRCRQGGSWRGGHYVENTLQVGKAPLHRSLRILCEPSSQVGPCNWHRGCLMLSFKRCMCYAGPAIICYIISVFCIHSNTKKYSFGAAISMYNLPLLIGGITALRIGSLELQICAEIHCAWSDSKMDWLVLQKPCTREWSLGYMSWHTYYSECCWFATRNCKALLSYKAFGVGDLVWDTMPTNQQKSQ